MNREQAVAFKNEALGTGRVTALLHGTPALNEPADGRIMGLVSKGGSGSGVNSHSTWKDPTGKKQGEYLVKHSQGNQVVKHTSLQADSADSAKNKTDKICPDCDHTVVGYRSVVQKEELIRKPAVSEKQRRAMAAAAHGNSTLGIPKSVGKDFMSKDPGGKLPERAPKKKIAALIDKVFGRKGDVTTAQLAQTGGLLEPEQKSHPSFTDRVHKNGSGGGSGGAGGSNGGTAGGTNGGGAGVSGPGSTSTDWGEREPNLNKLVRPKAKEDLGIAGGVKVSRGTNGENVEVAEKGQYAPGSTPGTSGENVEVSPTKKPWKKGDAYWEQQDWVAKRNFTDKKRKELAASGAAMADGSYPIENEKDLHNAISLVGMGNHSKASVKAHIKQRAKDLGLEGSLPDDWKDGSKDMKKEELVQKNWDEWNAAHQKSGMSASDKGKAIRGYSRSYVKSSVNYHKAQAAVHDEQADKAHAAGDATSEQAFRAASDQHKEASNAFSNASKAYDDNGRAAATDKIMYASQAAKDAYAASHNAHETYMSTGQDYLKKYKEDVQTSAIKYDGFGLNGLPRIVSKDVADDVGPIEDEDDLRDAIDNVDDDDDDAKQYIEQRASDLGLDDLIPW